jgi:methyltransferase-like protein
MSIEEIRIFVESSINAIYSENYQNAIAIEKLKTRLIKKVDKIIDQVRFVSA